MVHVLLHLILAGSSVLEVVEPVEDREVDPWRASYRDHLALLPEAYEACTVSTVYGV